jgi:hypothetical protein
VDEGPGVSAVASDRPLAPGNHIVRVKFDYDGGGIGKGATATLLVDEKQVAVGRIDKTVGVRFSLDETFDVGQDTGTPVLEEYESKMPFPFAGTLTKFVVVLQPQNLSEEKRQRRASLVKGSNKMKRRRVIQLVSRTRSPRSLGHVDGRTSSSFGMI